MGGMNQKALHNLLALGEGFTTEFKRSGTSNLGREICAFANATGGVILIGVTDAGEIFGVKDHNRLKSEVQAVARSSEPQIAVSEHCFTVIFPRPLSSDTQEEETSGKHPTSAQQVPSKYRTSTPQVRAMLLEAFAGDATRTQLQNAAGMKDREHFRKEYLQPLLDDGLLEMTVPEKPRSSKQSYRLTETGRAVLGAWELQR
jgi:predicted HTH transcriptional regulator